MRLPLRQLSDPALLATHRVARASLEGFRRATEAHGALIQSWVQGADVIALEHYPQGGVVDTRRGAEFFYHSHRADGAEHGHLHLFWHATRSGRRRYLRRASDAKPRREWTRSAPSHLLAIGLDARGLPLSVFSVNRWVTGGHWFDADTTLGMLRKFSVEGEGTYAHACAWLTAFVRLYEPVVARVLLARDRRLQARPELQAALEDRRLEVLSSARLDWAGDLQRLDEALRLRGLESPS